MTDDMLVTIVDHWQVRTDQIRNKASRRA